MSFIKDHLHSSSLNVIRFSVILHNLIFFSLSLFLDIFLAKTLLVIRTNNRGQLYVEPPFGLKGKRVWEVLIIL